MTMDDPWGSPWADEIQHPVVVTTENKDIEGNELRPKNPVRALNVRPDVNADSPWDNDGFGEWADLPTEELKGNGMVIDTAWESPRAGKDNWTTKGDFEGLPKIWDDPKPLPGKRFSILAPSLLPESPAILPKPSPDPWAAETILDNEELVDNLPAVEKPMAAMEIQEGDVESMLRQDVSEPLPWSNIESLARHSPREPVTRNEVGSGKSNLDPQLVEATEAGVSAHDDDQESSRPSSSTSDQSHHVEILSESPRTSLDDDQRNPQAPRKASANIQELVDHFDGLARQEEDATIERSRSRTRSASPSVMKNIINEHEAQVASDENEEVDEVDFGDFEEGQSEDDEKKREEFKPTVFPSPAPSQTRSSTESKRSSVEETQRRSQHVKRNYGRVGFPIDTSVLKKFVAQNGDGTLQDVAIEKVFIADAIPSGSFDSLEERKMWYRLSRYGSMRKHNSGEDENYVRITWPQSQVREQTLKIVSRWMEEDRISGRVILGGGIKGSSIFGWNDLNAPVVTVSSAFATKKERPTTSAEPARDYSPEIPREWPKGLLKDVSKPRSGSPSAPTTASKQNSAESASKSRSHNVDPISPVPNLIWSAGPTEQPPNSLLKGTIPISENPKPPPRHSKLMDPQPASAILVPMKANQTGSASSLLPSKPITASMPSTLPPTSENDDDWGEMVASPIVSTSPPSPLSQGLQHKKSQSLSGAFFPLQHTSPNSLSISPRGHKSTVSYDGIIAPISGTLLNLESNAGPLATLVPASAPPSPATQVPLSLVNSATSHNDPWASADFSFFDSAVPVTAPKPLPAPNSQATPKTVAFVKSPFAPSPLRHGKTRQQIEQDEIVESIVKSLPDLSYMLRR